MSVESQRLAAAQRTAAGKRGIRRPRRRTLVASWIFIVVMLSCFSFSVVAGARNVGKPDYDAAVAKLPAGKQLVLLRPEGGDDSLIGRLTRGFVRHELCTVTEGQIPVLAAHYSVGRISITVRGTAVPVATISGKGANVHDVKGYLGDPQMSCTIVQEKSVFFLPFDVHVS
jgi:hypothetical protein